MLRLESHPNHLQERIEKEGLARKKVMWVLITEDSLLILTKLALEELRYITLGVYQLKQAKSYRRTPIRDRNLLAFYTQRRCRHFETPGVCDSVITLRTL